MAKFDDVQRLHAVGQYTCIAAGGDMSDFQHLKDMLDSRVRAEFVEADGITSDDVEDAIKQQRILLTDENLAGCTEIGRQDSGSRRRLQDGEVGFDYVGRGGHRVRRADEAIEGARL